MAIYWGSNTLSSQAGLWITREKLWINRRIWGELGITHRLSFLSHPHIWGVVFATPHRSKMPVGWGKPVLFVLFYPQVALWRKPAPACPRDGMLHRAAPHMPGTTIPQGPFIHISTATTTTTILIHISKDGYSPFLKLSGRKTIQGSTTGDNSKFRVPCVSAITVISPSMTGR